MGYHDYPILTGILFVRESLTGTAVPATATDSVAGNRCDNSHAPKTRDTGTKAVNTHAEVAKSNNLFFTVFVLDVETFPFCPQLHSPIYNYTPKYQNHKMDSRKK
jgi:hypothetical protein